MTAPTQHFGPRVLGQEEYDRQVKAVQAHQTRGIGLGKRVTEPSPSPKLLREAKQRAAAEIPLENDEVAVAVEAPPEPETPERPETVVLSIRQMQEVFEENESIELFDRLHGEEMERSEPGPRKGALQILLAVERQREEPREAVIAELTQALSR